MITIVGTGHVFNISREIERLIEEKEPDLICVELDERRYLSLISGERKTENLPVIYRILSKFQQRVSEWYGTRVGSEMLTAIKIAKEKNIDLELIDMDADKIFMRFLKEMSFKEKLSVFFSALIGLFGRRSKIEKEIDKVKDKVDEILDEIEKKFPTIKKLLVDERDEYMARKLISLSEKYCRIIAFVGDGHVPGIEKRLKTKNIEVEVIRLKDLQKNDGINFTVEYGPVA